MIYLNHAGTTWPRPGEVVRAMETAQAWPPELWPGQLEQARSEVAAFLGVPDPQRMLFTPGCTAALNVALSDLPWAEGDRVVTSGLEHHALTRPLAALSARGVAHLVAPYVRGEPVELGFVERRLREGSVRLVAVTGASNVTGERLPAEEITALAHAHGALVLLDVAQTAGIAPLDAAALGVDILVFAGHKALCGPQGVGGLYVRAGVELASPAAACDLRSAAACSSFPSYCDVGSVNLAGVAGLAAGVRWLRAHGAASASRARAAAARFLDGLESIPGVTVFGGRDPERRTCAVSLALEGAAPAELERRLLGEHGIATRAGHHCAPLAHETLGTAEQGTLRVSFGHGSSEGDAEAALDALRRLAA